jgi:hypothetical protein
MQDIIGGLFMVISAILDAVLKHGTFSAKGF